MPRTPKQSPDAVPLMVRLPPDLHAALVRAAADDERSLNSQVIVLLRAALAPPPSVKPAVPKPKPRTRAGRSRPT